MKSLLLKPISHQSLKLFSNIWFHFQDFILCVLGETLQLPVSVSQLAKYVVYLYLNGCSFSTVRTHICIINVAHAVRDLPLPGASIFISKLIRGIGASQSACNDWVRVYCPVSTLAAI